MKNTRANQIIVEVLQNALAGQLDPSSNVNPQFIAEAISSKVVFEKAYEHERMDEAFGALIDAIVKTKDFTEGELNRLNPNEKLLANFLRGKITSYEEVLGLIKIV